MDGPYKYTDRQFSLCRLPNCKRVVLAVSDAAVAVDRRCICDEENPPSLLCASVIWTSTTDRGTRPRAFCRRASIRLCQDVAALVRLGPENFVRAAESPENRHLASPTFSRCLPSMALPQCLMKRRAGCALPFVEAAWTGRKRRMWRSETAV